MKTSLTNNEEHSSAHILGVPERLLRAQVFGRVRVDPGWSSKLAAASRDGTVVHVMRSSSSLELLCLDYVCKRARLPLIRYANVPTQVGKLLGDQLLGGSSPHDDDRVLQNAVSEGDSALLFLRSSPRVAQLKRSDEGDPITTLVRAQRQTQRPILLVPQTLVWSKLPSHKRKTFSDLVFGPSEEPGSLRALSHLLLNPSDTLLSAGPPFDLHAFLLAHDDLSDEVAANKVRYALLRRVERERTVVLGPSTKSPTRIRDEILRSPRLRPHFESAARAGKKSVEEIKLKAAMDLDHIIAAPNATVLGLMNRGLDRVWNQLYDGLVVDEEGMARVREASRHGTLVLFPSHKSHIDYVVLSDVFYARGLSTPIVAAGDNLNFWPLGSTLRRAGAFFIHRALAGQKLYSALLAAYIRRLLLEGFTLEVFLEGGRSRTGKLLTPKLGLLSMIVDAALAMHDHPIYFVPISIAYERVIEERSFVHELAGFEKQSEDIAGLLQTPQVFRARYGRLFMQVGEIFSFEDTRKALQGKALSKDDGPLSPKARRALIQDIANRTAREINRVTVVTPSALTATTLLSHRRRGVTKAEVVELAKELLTSLVARGARIAAPLSTATNQTFAPTISEAIELFVDADLLLRQRTGPETIYRVPSAQRIALEYYKNSIIHFFAPTAIVATILLAADGQPLEQDALFERAARMRERLKLELPMPGDDALVFETCTQIMHGAGEIDIEGPMISLRSGSASTLAERYAWMIRGSLESLRIALRGTHALRQTPTTLKDWLKATIALGERMYVAGEIEVREAISRDRLENALHALHELGLVRLQSDASVGVGKLLTPERVRDEDDELKRYLR